MSGCVNCGSPNVGIWIGPDAWCRPCLETETASMDEIAAAFDEPAVAAERERLRQTYGTADNGLRVVTQKLGALAGVGSGPES